MTRHETTPCKGPKCGKPIIWSAITKEDGTPGKMPLDPRAPCYEIVGTGGLPASGATARRAPNAYVSHFATCADVNRFTGGDASAQGEIDDLTKRLTKALDEIATLKEQVARARGGKAAAPSLFDQGG